MSSSIKLHNVTGLCPCFSFPFSYITVVCKLNLQAVKVDAFLDLVLSRYELEKVYSIRVTFTHKELGNLRFFTICTLVVGINFDINV